MLRIYHLGKKLDTEGLVWNAHPAFKGVFLKHLVKGEDTDGKFSCHLVKVEPGCEIGEHIHEGKWETHEVIKGKGKCVLIDKEISYELGVCALIPADMKHRVLAGQEGLYLFVEFIPALL